MSGLKRVGRPLTAESSVAQRVRLMSFEQHWHIQNTWHLLASLSFYLAVLSFSPLSFSHHRLCWLFLPDPWFPGSDAPLCMPSREASYRELAPAADGAFQSGEWGHCEGLWVMAGVGGSLLIYRPLTHSHRALRTESQRQTSNLSAFKCLLRKQLCECVRDSVCEVHGNIGGMLANVFSSCVYRVKRNNFTALWDAGVVDVCACVF